MKTKQHNISTREDIQTVYMTRFAHSNDPHETVTCGEGSWGSKQRQGEPLERIPKAIRNNSRTRGLSKRTHRMCMRNPRKANSTNMRRVSQYSKENDKTTPYLSERRDKRTVAMTSSPTKNVPAGSAHMRWRVTRDHTHGVSSNRCCLGTNHENEVPRIKTQVFTIQVNNENNTISPRQRISELSTWQHSHKITPKEALNEVKGDGTHA